MTKRIISIFIIVAIAVAMFVLPASAAENVFIPPCNACGSQNVSYFGKNVYRDSSGIPYYVEYIYKCHDCEHMMYIDASYVT